MGKIEVLVTTMFQKDTSKYESMNLQTDAIIANQSDDCFYIEERKGDSTVKMVTTNTRGVSRNRNMALAYATAEYVMFADDDQVMVDNYEKVIEDEFRKCPNADAIKFYCESTNQDRPMSFKKPAKLHKADKRELMSAGVHCLAVRREYLLSKNISFQANIGPGEKIICGEDTAFYFDLLTKGARIYATPTFLSYIDQGESSWFNGYTEKYFKSVGYIYSRIYGRMASLAILRRAYRLRGKADYTYKQMVDLMNLGMKEQRARN